ncbi:hypothetical protein [Draconibacterium sp.]
MKTIIYLLLLTILFAATGNGPKAWKFDKTWNMVIPLKTSF